MCIIVLGDYVLNICIKTVRRQPRKTVLCSVAPPSPRFKTHPRDSAADAAAAATTRNVCGEATAAAVATVTLRRADCLFGELPRRGKYAFPPVLCTLILAATADARGKRRQRRACRPFLLSRTPTSPSLVRLRGEPALCCWRFCRHRRVFSGPLIPL